MIDNSLDQPRFKRITPDMPEYNHLSPDAKHFDSIYDRIVFSEGDEIDVSIRTAMKKIITLSERNGETGTTIEEREIFMNHLETVMVLMNMKPYSS